MELHHTLRSLLLFGLVSIAPPLLAYDNQVSQLGPVGGTFVTLPGSGLLWVASVTAGGPGAVAGLQAGDVIYGAFGEDFAPLSTIKINGYKGSVQDYGEAIERAEAGNVPLPLKVIRPGTGAVTVSITLPNAGPFGAAYPLGSPKFDAIYEWACAQMHTMTTSIPGGFGYKNGWFGLCLLAHANWNDTAGPKPYRLSINKLRDYCLTNLNNAIREPLEWDQPGYVYAGLENWELSMSAMFLAEYRRKSGDTAVNPTIQRAAELLANRVQYWRQPDDGNPNHPGMMGHGGVTADYEGGGINIINVHALIAMGLLKNAGADFSGVSGTTAGTAPQALTYLQRVQTNWAWLKQCTLSILNDPETGNVGYAGLQGGECSSARTAGAIAGFKLFNLTPSADDTAKLDLMRVYMSRQWQRLQHSHAYTIGGVSFYQMALPFLADRDQRFIMENLRFFYHLHRTASGTLEYFGGRELNDGDSAPDYNRAVLIRPAIINTAIARAIAGGTLPSFPIQNTTRLYSRMIQPWVKWPTLEAHAGKINAATATLEVQVTDYLGVAVASGLSAAWTRVSGPGTVNFGSPNALTTTATFSADGVYRLQLVASKGGYTLTEPYDFTVVRNPVTPPDPLAPAITVHPANLTRTLGGSATFSVSATGDGPLVYLWRLNGVAYWPVRTNSNLVLNNIGGGLAGNYDCVVTGRGGSAISDVAVLTISNAGMVADGGLWQEKYEQIDGSAITNLTDASSLFDIYLSAELPTGRFPRFPDSSGVINSSEDPAPNPPSGDHNSYGQLWTGWLKPTVTGDYKFYLTADDSAELWLSSTDEPSGRGRIVSVLPTPFNAVFNAGARKWSAGERSESIPLVAGRRYYLELLHKNAFNGYHVEFTWQKPGDPVPADGSAPIGSAFLEYRVGGEFYDTRLPGVSVTPRSTTVVVGETVGFTAAPLGTPPFSYQWKYNNVTLVGETSATLSLVNVQLSASGQYTVEMNNAFGTVSATAELTVRTPPPAMARILADQPVAYWRLNEHSGATAQDTLGGHHGTVQGPLLFGVAGASAPEFPGFEPNNTAAQFNGAGSKIAVPGLNLNTDTVTVTGWVKRNGNQGFMSGIWFYRDAASNGFGLAFTTDNQITYAWNEDYWYWDTGLVPPDGQWTFVALVVQPNRAIIYMATDSTLYSATNFANHAVQAFAGTSYIGQDTLFANGRYMKGQLDELAIFNRALTPTQLSQILGAATDTVPVVTLATPASGATFNAPATVNFSASVTANGHTINSVRYYSGQNLLGSAATAPYNFAWTSVPAGAYTVSAEVVYDTTQTLSSAPAFITVEGGATPPTATTLAATEVLSSGATLNGSANPSGSSAIGFFQWGTTSGYGQNTPPANLGSGTAAVPFSTPLSGLTPGQTYHFRAAASNSAGVVYGDDMTLTMLTIQILGPLIITRSGGDVIISWPDGFNGILQQSPSLAPATWINSPSGAAHPITFPASNPTMFYRLANLPTARWASRVLGYSSAYGANPPDDWSAAQALGQANTYPAYGDLPTAWSSASPDEPAEFLELGFDAPAPINSVSIYETYKPGAVSKVSVRNPNTGLWVEVWSGTAAPAAAAARIFNVTFPLTSFPVDVIRIDLNSAAVPDYNEIDAVSIQ